MNTLDKTRKAQTPIIKSKFQHFTLGYHTHVWTQKTQGRARIPDKVKNNSGDQSTTPDMQTHGNSKQDSVVLIQTEQFQHSMLVNTLKIKQESTYRLHI
jgi:hypothetical protein